MQVATQKQAGISMSALAILGFFTELVVLWPNEPLWMRIIISFVLAIILASGLVSWYRAENHVRLIAATKELLDHYLETRRYDVHIISSEGEVRALEALDVEIYGPAALPGDQLLSWWLKYPKGIHVVYDPIRLVGAIGMWPISEEAYAQLMRGERTEASVTAADLRTNEQHDQAHWYLAGVLVRNGYRASRVLPNLLATAIRTWIEETGALVRVGLLAVATSKQGEGYLNKFGFSPVATVTAPADQYPRYVVEHLTPQGILDRLKRFVHQDLDLSGTTAQ
jgi:hypothetical protein